MCNVAVSSTRSTRNRSRLIFTSPRPFIRIRISNRKSSPPSGTSNITRMRDKARYWSLRKPQSYSPTSIRLLIPGQGSSFALSAVITTHRMPNGTYSPMRTYPKSFAHRIAKGSSMGTPTVLVLSRLPLRSYIRTLISSKNPMLISAPATATTSQLATRSRYLSSSQLFTRILTGNRTTGPRISNAQWRGERQQVANPTSSTSLPPSLPAAPWGEARGKGLVCPHSDENTSQQVRQSIREISQASRNSAEDLQHLFVLAKVRSRGESAI